jgi:5-methylcytosine-specific restriction endonuclease McrA
MGIRSRNSKQRKSLMRTLRKRDGALCHICHQPMNFRVVNLPRSATFDHIIPKSMGGKDRADNLKLAHQLCNVRRGASGEAVLAQSGFDSNRRLYSLMHCGCQSAGGFPPRT